MDNNSHITHEKQTIKNEYIELKETVKEFTNIGIIAPIDTTPNGYKTPCCKNFIALNSGIYNLTR